jgi:ubiquitin conjugation factor E4 B
LVTAIAEDPLFQMATSAPGIEKHTLFGPFFRISPLQPEVAKEYFSAPKTMDPRRIQTSQEALRLTLQTHQRDLLDIINLFVRAGPTSKSRTLDWFAYIVNSNHKRRALQPDAKSLSSDGFLMNVTVVLDGLCEPFMDTTFSKVSRIDVDYLRRNPRVDIKEETKLNADQNASDEYYETTVEGTSNFISEVFFLTLAAHHYGSEATNGMLKSLGKEIKYLAGKLAEMEAERPKVQASMVGRLSTHPCIILTSCRINIIFKYSNKIFRDSRLSWKGTCRPNSPSKVFFSTNRCRPNQYCS